MPEQKERRSFKVGCVRVRPLGSGKWQADFSSDPNAPEKGQRTKRTFHALSMADARRQAVDFHNRAVAGEFRVSARAAAPTVREAIEAAVDASNANPKTRAQYLWNMERFLEWLARARPAVKRWGDLGTDAIRAYAMHGHRELHLARATLHSRLVPIKMASRYWCEDEPDRYRDVARPARLPKEEVSHRERAAREQAKALSGADTLTLLRYLKERRPDLYAPAMLQALCGLRILEVLSLRECDVDFERGVIAVTETETHKPKTVRSDRDVPLPPFVLAVLRDVVAHLPIGDRKREIFLSNLGEPWAGFDGYCHALRKAMNTCWEEWGIESLRNFTPRNLRATFATGVRSAGADARVVQAYLGHSLGDVLGSHYEQVSVERMRAEVIPAVEKWCPVNVPTPETHPMAEGVSLIESWS